MKTLLVQNSFEPYYSGRDSDRCKWEVRAKKGDRVEEIKVEHEGDASVLKAIEDKRAHKAA